jgi:biotin-dependent carboxylase-like uncharacterized protein
MTSGGSLRVITAGSLTTVQDQGRRGLAHLGVAAAGALDRPAADLANRVVGNDPASAVLEVTLGGLRLTSTTGIWVALTGAVAPLRMSGQARGHACAEWLSAGAVMEVGVPLSGVRSYVAVSGGIDVPPVLGSRSTDTLGWVGPPQVTDGMELPLGPPQGSPAAHDTPRPAVSGPLRIRPGPRDDWFVGKAIDTLLGAPYVVDGDSNRIGLRLSGPTLARARGGELPSEGLVLGAVQVPPSGHPVVMLADHPATGGYPVIGVVHREDVWRCAQLRPGETVRFGRG